MWTKDIHSKSEKEKEILNNIKILVENELNIDTNYQEEIIEIISDSITVTAPMVKEEEVIMTYTMLNYSKSMLNGASNYRKGNILFNLRSLLDSLTDSAVAVVGGITTPEVMPYAIARVLINIFKVNPIKVNLSKREGYIIYTMHLFNGKIDEDNLLKQINLQLVRNKEITISKNDFDESISILIKLKIVENDGNSYKLIDKIAFNYGNKR